MDKLAENNPYGYSPRGYGQQRPPYENMNYRQQAMPQRNRPINNSNRPQNAPPPHNTPPPPPAEPSPKNIPAENKQSGSNILSMLGIKELDEEKLILIALIVILARSGADWVILAALAYIMM